MDLFLIRHAKAEDGSFYAGDDERPLTADGRIQAREVGQSLAKAGVRFDVMISSGLLRANETAKIIAHEVGYHGLLLTDARISPEGRPHQIVEEVIAPRTEERVALVGHEPSMGKLLSALLGKPGLAMAKGGVARVAWDGKHGRLQFVVKPKKLEPSGSLDDL
jgi:phosphohistidine phosphatase